jgi:tetratricopeptide (TPR) repeat protein
LHGPVDASEVVKLFLKAQNLEQLGHNEQAIELYEAAVNEGFDATGPYDRLIALYADQARHRDVVRVAEAAIEHVHTYEDKRAWYEQMRVAALRAQQSVPRATPKNRS